MAEPAIRARFFKPLFGLAVCATAAGFSCALFRWSHSKTALLLLVFVVITLVSIRYGRLAGVLGTSVAAAIFALSIFPPVGSLDIDDMSQRTTVAWFWVGGITVSFLIGSASETSNHARRPPSSPA